MNVCVNKQIKDHCEVHWGTVKVLEKFNIGAMLVLILQNWILQCILYYLLSRKKVKSQRQTDIKKKTSIKLFDFRVVAWIRKCHKGNWVKIKI